MIKVIVASQNPVKIKAVTRAFKRMLPHEHFEFIGISVPSGVSNQPHSNDETYKGAKNRADNASLEILDGDYYVGIEGGIEHVEDETESFAWIIIKSLTLYGKARTGAFFIPLQVAQLIKEGKELGEADDIVFGRTNSKQDNGAVGILTKNVIDRTSYYEDAVILALIPFVNKGLYEHDSIQ